MKTGAVVRASHLRHFVPLWRSRDPLALRSRFRFDRLPDTRRRIESYAAIRVPSTVFLSALRKSVLLLDVRAILYLRASRA